MVAQAPSEPHKLPILCRQIPDPESQRVCRTVSAPLCGGVFPRGAPSTPGPALRAVTHWPRWGTGWKGPAPAGVARRWLPAPPSSVNTAQLCSGGRVSGRVTFSLRAGGWIAFPPHPWPQTHSGAVLWYKVIGFPPAEINAVND